MNPAIRNKVETELRSLLSEGWLYVGKSCSGHVCTIALRHTNGKRAQLCARHDSCLLFINGRFRKEL